MNIGIQTRPWGPAMNRDNLDQVLTEIAVAGYTGFEIGAQHLDLSNPTFLRNLAEEHGLEVVGIHVGGEIYDPAAVQMALRMLEPTIMFAQAVGATFLPFSGRLRQNKTQAELNHQAESLNRIGELCRRQGLTLCYHNHFWEIENECAELRHLCDRTDPSLVWLCLDVGWVQRAGSAPAEVVETYFERIGYLHLKDTTADEWREIGYGSLDLAALMQVIRRRPDWWLVVEQDETKRQPVESARMSRAFLKQQLGI